MAVNDPIADFLTRIRNAQMAKHASVEIPHSKMKAEIARILKEEGYVSDFSEKGSGSERVLVVELKYGPDGERAIAGLRRMSRPGRRVYRKQKEIARVGRARAQGDARVDQEPGPQRRHRRHGRVLEDSTDRGRRLQGPAPGAGLKFAGRVLASRDGLTARGRGV